MKRASLLILVAVAIATAGCSQLQPLLPGFSPIDNETCAGARLVVDLVCPVVAETGSMLSARDVGESCGTVMLFDMAERRRSVSTDSELMRKSATRTVVRTPTGEKFTVPLSFDRVNAEFDEHRCR